MGKVIAFKRKGGVSMEKGRLDALKVADFFLSLEGMTNKKLLKLCYYSQAWYYAFYKKGLFKQDIEAWVHGPVVVDVYNKFRDYRWNKIPKKNISVSLDKEIEEFLLDIYETYKEFNGDQLESLTHSEKPWLEARDGLEEWEPSHNIINPDTMQSYYWGVYEAGQN